MFKGLKKLGRGRKASPAKAPPFEPALTPGERVYAIGDIHGRVDLFNELLVLIDRDHSARRPARTSLILLGDLVDRGPQSNEVVERAIQLRAAGDRFRAIKGNHEEVMLSAFAGDESAMRLFLRIGGIETLESYGIDVDTLPRGKEMETLIQRMRDAVPRAHVDYLTSMEDQIAMGDYLFVHAGIRPGVPLDQQKATELRWIRGSFLDHAGHHGVMVVHGHSITDEPVIRPNRVGIDTGAYQTGVLTALGIEGKERWLIQTGQPQVPLPQAAEAEA